MQRKQLLGLACITTSTLTFSVVGALAAYDAITTFNAYLDTLNQILAGGGL